MAAHRSGGLLAFLSATCREEFNLTELFREPLLCIVPQDWPEPPNGIMTPELMNGQSFVVQCDATDAEMRQFLKKYSISTERRCHVIDDQSNIAMVEAGLGISIMPRMLLRNCTAAVKIYSHRGRKSTGWWVWLSSVPPQWLRRSEQMFHHIVDFCRQIGAASLRI
ncbi:MAG: LysR family transcriptional regulator substrate-binding protein [Faecalibacterium prausnitzii]